MFQPVFTLHIFAREDKNMCMCQGVDSQLMKKWLRTYKTTHFDHPLMLAKTCLRWLIYLSNRSLRWLIYLSNRSLRWFIYLSNRSLRWFIYLSNRFFVEETARALKNNFLSVPRFHAFDANDSQCK